MFVFESELAFRDEVSFLSDRNYSFINDNLQYFADVGQETDGSQVRQLGGSLSLLGIAINFAFFHFTGK